MHFYAENTSGNSNKFYEMALSDDPEKASDGTSYVLVAEFGRIGVSSQQHLYRRGTYDEVRKLFAEKRKEKLGRGYNDLSRGLAVEGQDVKKKAAVYARLTARRETPKNAVVEPRWADQLDEEAARFLDV